MTERTKCVFCGLLRCKNGKCQTCGTYEYKAGTSIDNFVYLRRRDCYLISGYVREQNEVNKHVPEFDSVEACESAIEHAPKRIPERAAKLLKIVQYRTGYFGQDVEFCSNDYPLGYCRVVEEFNALIGYCRQRKWVTYHPENALHGNTSMTIRLTAEGFEELECRARANVESEKAFVAMRFSDEMKLIYDDAIEPAIRECGFRAMRIDQHDKIGDVVDLMIAEIRESRFVVADFTERNEGVYFETGFAMGLSLPVISSCRGDWMKELHFDTNHFSHIKWSNAEELKEGLIARIRANIGLGPIKPKQ